MICLQLQRSRSTPVQSTVLTTDSRGHVGVSALREGSRHSDQVTEKWPARRPVRSALHESGRRQPSGARYRRTHHQSPERKPNGGGRVLGDAEVKEKEETREPTLRRETFHNTGNAPTSRPQSTKTCLSRLCIVGRLRTKPADLRQVPTRKLTAIAQGCQACAW